MEDKRLKRLYDYTKFHIGIYLSATAGLMALVSIVAKKDEAAVLGTLIGSPRVLVAAALAMLVAGIAGAIVASSSTGCKTYEELWNQRWGPYNFRILKGQHWASLEHTSFWISILFTIYSVGSAPAVRCLIRTGSTCILDPLGCSWF